MATFKHTETGDEVAYPDGSFYAELAAESAEWEQTAGDPVVVPEALPTMAPAAEVVDPKPKKSASHDEWAAYAIAHGVPSFEAQNLTRDELVERMG
jgi:hypothetical protein